MSYTIYKSDGTPVIVPDNVIDDQFYDSSANGPGQGIGLQLIGQHANDYGAPIAQSFLQLTENFAGTVIPSDSTSLIGQGWLNKSDSKLYIKVTDSTVGIANWESVVTFNQAGDLTVPGDLTVLGSTNIPSISGNAGTATKLQTPRTISSTGDIAWSVLFDGSANVTNSVTLPSSGVSAGLYGSASAIPSVTIDAEGRITSATTAGITTTVTGAVSGSGTGTVATTLANSGVSAGSYTNASVTVDAAGRVLSASNGTGGVTIGDFTGANQSLLGNGYQKFPGGLLMQWGFQSGNGGSVTFPIAFSSILTVGAQCLSNESGGGSDGPSFGILTGSVTTTGFSFVNYDNKGIFGIRYIAYGT